MKNLILILISGVVLLSCNYNNIYKKNSKLSDYRWEKTNTLLFEPEIVCDTCLYNLIFSIRYVYGIPYTQIPVNFIIESPSGITETINANVFVKDDKGKYIGDGSGDIWDLDYSILNDYTFSEKGIYKILVSHNADFPTLNLIMSIGFKISKVH